MFKGIDLYSDTATKPSTGMKQAMMEAALGDEQRGEDPTTLRLEELVAEMLNKQHLCFSLQPLCVIKLPQSCTRIQAMRF